MIQQKKRLWAAVSALLILILAVAAFYGCYLNDNKYTASLPVLQDGSVQIPKMEEENRVLFLTDEWEFYPNLLLEPADFQQQGHTPVKMRVGQYASFSPFHQDGSPYGMGTYRIVIRGEKVKEQVLALPEVFCAYRLYLNGNLVLENGGTEPYSPYIQQRVALLPMEETVEVVIQVVNQTHYYSGLYYPPAVGSLEAVGRMFFVRSLVYGTFVLFSLGLALFSIAVWAGTRQTRSGTLFWWLGLLALSFAIRSCHVFFSAVGFSHIRLIYLLEDTGAFFNILCILKITLHLTGRSDTTWGKLVFWIGIYGVVAGAVFPTLILPALPAFVPIYGSLVFWYKAGTSLAVVGMALGQKRLDRDFLWILIPGEIHAVSLLARVFALPSYEPAYTAWPDEYGAFALVLCFAVVMVRQSVEMAKENAHLRHNLQQEVAEKTRSLQLVLESRKQFLAGAAHDLKAPITLLQLYTQAVEQSGVGLDEETVNYLKMIQRKSDEMKERLGELQTFAYEDARPLCMERLDLGEIVKSFYQQNLPDIEASGIYFILEMPDKPCIIQGDRERLCRVLQNLVYNAWSFVPADGNITLSLTIQDPWAILKISDTGQGILPENLPRIFDRYFSTRDGEGGSGYGLYLVKSFVLEHGGDISAQSEYGHGSTFTVHLPLSSD